MTASYDRSGLKFLYPENWKITDQVDDSLPRAITLEAPGGSAIWAIHAYPGDDDFDHVLKSTLGPLRETYFDLEVTPIENELSDSDEPAVESLFFCLDFLVRAKIQIVKTPDNVLVFWYQGEDREFDNLEMVFQAISTSLLQSIER